MRLLQRIPMRRAKDFILQVERKGMAATSPVSRKQMLVVDNDPDVHDFVVHALREEPFQIVSCRTAREGFRAMEGQSFDVILLDLGLPDIHGFEVLSRLRRVESPSRVIVVTADGKPEDLLRALRENAFGYLRKPLSATELADLAGRALALKAEPVIDVISGKRDWLELSIPCTLHSADRAEHFVRQLCADLEVELMDAVARAFRELLMNAVEWGGGLDPSRRVRISCLRTSRMLLYRIADPGPGFRFEELSHSALVNPGGALAASAIRAEKALRPGGFGLITVQAIADDLLYNEVQNEVVFVKYLS